MEVRYRKLFSGRIKICKLSGENRGLWTFKSPIRGLFSCKILIILYNYFINYDLNVIGKWRKHEKHKDDN